ncbi:MAG: HIT family protein [Succinivibrio sp.]|jgi:diadenosine tetraphosphate (Ap4A) HIT family hydrolase|nr:HIT family protein [Succinivibrio sp.]
MKDQNCFYCMDTDKRRELMTEITSLKLADLYLFRDQTYTGRCVLKFRDHKTDFSQLTDEENLEFAKELRQVAAALTKAFHPDKINYAVYGDLVPHLHIHIVPKYKGGPQWGGPFTDTGPKKYLSDAEYQELIAKIRAAL